MGGRERFLEREWVRERHGYPLLRQMQRVMGPLPLMWVREGRGYPLSGNPLLSLMQWVVATGEWAPSRYVGTGGESAEPPPAKMMYIFGEWSRSRRRPALIRRLLVLGGRSHVWRGRIQPVPDIPHGDDPSPFRAELLSEASDVHVHGAGFDLKLLAIIPDPL